MNSQSNRSFPCKSMSHPSFTNPFTSIPIMAVRWNFLAGATSKVINVHVVSSQIAYSTGVTLGKCLQLFVTFGIILCRQLKTWPTFQQTYTAKTKLEMSCIANILPTFIGQLLGIIRLINIDQLRVANCWMLYI